MKLLLKPGPKLIRKRWKKGKWRKKDVTAYWQHYLFWPECKVKGVTLRDILLLLKSDLEFAKKVFHPHIEELIEEGLQPGETDLDYLELYQAGEIHEKEGLCDLTFPSFHGIKSDEDMAYCIMYEPVNNLADLEIVKGGWSVYVAPEYGNPVCVASKFPVSLGQIIQAVVHEISWFGTPEHRDEHAKGLAGAMDEAIKNEMG
jgi:hypothetical protein